jgi:predicted flap endonuclease-1-like 5' DNA nuclease
MVMLTFQTFLLLLLSGLFGVVVGSLFGCGGLDWSDDRPWLRDGRAAPPAPLLPAAPVLLSADERARLAASLDEAKATPTAESVSAGTPAPIASPEPAPTSIVVEASAVAPVATAAPEPAPVPEPQTPAETAPPPVAATDTTPSVPAAPAAPAEEAPAAFALPPEIAAAAVAPTVAAEDASRAAAADAVGTRPLALAAPLGGKADDLKRIRGIGPQNERKLHGLGVYHFSQIAAWSAENAKWAGSFMAFPGRIEREDWIAQAAILATGAETAFSKRVDAGEVPTSQSDGKS